MDVEGYLARVLEVVGALLPCGRLPVRATVGISVEGASLAHHPAVALAEDVELLTVLQFVVCGVEHL